MNDVAVISGEEISDDHMAPSSDDAIAEELRSVYPKARIYTGKIESTYLYKRRYKKGGDHSHNQETSFWWVTIKTSEGKLVSYNIRSEDSNFDSIKRGDLISFVITKEISLWHPFLEKKDRKIVQSNDLATTVVFHRGENGIYARDKLIYPEKEATNTFPLIMSSIALAITFFVQNGKLDNPYLQISVAIFIGTIFYTLFNWKNTRRNYDKDKRLYAALEIASNKLLGLHMIQGLISDTSLQSELEASEVNYSQRLAGLAGSDLDLSASWQDNFVYRHVLAQNDKGILNSQMYLARVVKKDVSVVASKSKSSYTQKTTTTYRERRYGMKIGETHSYRDFSHTSRTSDISGRIEVCTAVDESVEVAVPTDALRSIDIGDVLLIGRTSANIDGDEYRFREVTYNLTKDINTEGASIRNFGYISDWAIVLVVAAAAGTFYMDYQTAFDQEFLKMYFAPFSGFVLSMSAINWLRNKRIKNKNLKPFKQKTKLAESKRIDILDAVG